MSELEKVVQLINDLDKEVQEMDKDMQNIFKRMDALAQAIKEHPNPSDEERLAIIAEIEAKYPVSDDRKELN